MILVCRTSILEMKKDHEEQVQTLKRLKDEEIDAVTSATSQTRSPTSTLHTDTFLGYFSVRYVCICRTGL